MHRRYITEIAFHFILTMPFTVILFLNFLPGNLQCLSPSFTASRSYIASSSRWLSQSFTFLDSLLLLFPSSHSRSMSRCVIQLLLSFPSSLCLFSFLFHVASPCTPSSYCLSLSFLSILCFPLF